MYGYLGNNRLVFDRGTQIYRDETGSLEDWEIKKKNEKRRKKESHTEARRHKDRGEFCNFRVFLRAFVPLCEDFPVKLEE